MLRSKALPRLDNLRFVSEVPGSRKKPPLDYRNLRLSRAVYGCGLAKTGSLATPTLVEKRNNPEVISRPFRINYCVGKKIKKVAAGFGFSLFASSEELFGSGLNNFYQLGGPVNDENQRRSQEYYIAGKKIKLPEDAGKIVDIAAGRLHSLVATTSKVYAFGDNAQGQCGKDPTIYPFVTHDAGYTKLESVALPDGAVPKKVHCSLDTSFVILEDGRLLSFGLNADGQTGCDSLQAVNWHPHEVQGDAKGEHIVDVGGSGDTLLAVNRNGDVFAWGLNEYGQFNSVTDDVQVACPRALHFQLGKVTSVAATGSSCILSTDEGLAYSWGAQILGFGPDLSFVPRPMAMDPPLFSSAANQDGKVAKVFASSYSMGALTASGNFYSWGMNRYGILGLGHADNQFFPFQVFIPEQLKTVSMGCDHTLFLI